MKLNAAIWQQVIGFLLFVALVATTAWSCLFIGCRLSFDFLKKRPLDWYGKREKIVVTFGALGLLCVLYGFLVEPYWLSVETVHLTSPKLASGEPIRLVHISDMHCDPKKRLEDQLPIAIANEHPDAILFTGDALNTPAGLPHFKQCMTALAKIAPTFAVRGNWDTDYWSKLDLYGGTGVTELNGNAVPLTVKGRKLWIGGLPARSEATVTAVMKDVPESDYRVFLFHFPDNIDEMVATKIDLYLAGHTHGGQIALPFYGAIVTLAATGKEYEAGLYHKANTALYVNRGIGMEGGSAPRVRFCARPEVTVVELTTQAH